MKYTEPNSLSYNKLYIAISGVSGYSSERIIMTHIHYFRTNTVTFNTNLTKFENKSPRMIKTEAFVSSLLGEFRDSVLGELPVESFPADFQDLGGLRLVSPCIFEGKHDELLLRVSKADPDGYLE